MPGDPQATSIPRTEKPSRIAMTIWIDQKTDRMVRQEAAKQRRTISAQVELAIEEYFAERVAED